MVLIKKLVWLIYYLDMDSYNFEMIKIWILISILSSNNICLMIVLKVFTDEYWDLKKCLFYFF